MIPVPIADDTLDALSGTARKLALEVGVLVVERARTARRYLKSLDKTVNIDAIEILEVDQALEQLDSLMATCRAGTNIGVMSEAGCPGVADPGAKLVAAAHRSGVQVVPLVGPSSILLALMASGFSGQGFTFHGYLPVNKNALRQALRQLESEVQRTGFTQLFMDTPYRNLRMFEALMDALQPYTLVSISASLTAPDAYTSSKPVSKWRQEGPPAIDKVPAIFSIGT